ncbi:MAG: sigma-70 family RNA polymerase sigma factor [Xanthomonadales bacterium]|nr:sigma-70 family RNA polymerase sigma factor [Xanthomonadales bacterium]
MYAMAVKEQQFEEIWSQHAATVRARLRGQRLLDAAIDLEDLEQDVRLRLWKALSSETRINHAGSYLRRVVNSALIDAVRRAQARESSRRASNIGEKQDADPAALTQDNPEKAAKRDELSATIQSVLDSLSAGRRRAVTLRLHGLAVNEIGALCGWKESKARNLVYRGLEQLRTELNKRGIELEDH